MRIWLGGLALALGLATSALAAQNPATPLPPAMAAELAAANRILVDQGVIDVRGHVSLRDPTDPNRFWIARAVPPGLATPIDLQLFDLEGRQVGGVEYASYSDRFIHARIYKARPDVKAIVHAQTPSLITMSVSGLPIRPVMTAGLFAASGVPVHVNGRSGEGIHDAEHGDALARTLGASNAVLMQGHGAVIVGKDVVTAVGRAVGLDQNTRIQIDLIAMGVTPVVLEPATAPESDYAREWSWWTHRIAP
jgi:ribulose-5-phosphate 4-epimerase/fuculose-1-phosphate aldolase